MAELCLVCDAVRKRFLLRNEKLNNFDTLFVRAHGRAPLQKTQYSVLFNPQS